MKIAVIIIMLVFIIILCLPIMIAVECTLLLDLSNITYDLSIGLITGLISGLATTLISFYFANVIPQKRLRNKKYNQYLEIVKRHGSGLAYAYSEAYVAFLTFNKNYKERDFTSKNLWLMFIRRTTAVSSAVDRMLTLHSEFNTNMALLLDLIPKGCADNLKKANLDFCINMIMSSYNSYRTYISSNLKKKYSQESYDIEFNLHANITTYMMAMKSIEEYNKIYPKTGIALFQLISKIHL